MNIHIDFSYRIKIHISIFNQNNASTYIGVYLTFINIVKMFSVLIYCLCTIIGSYFIYFLGYSTKVIFIWIFVGFVCYCLFTHMIQSNSRILKKLYGGFPAVSSYNTQHVVRSCQPRTPGLYSLYFDDKIVFCDPISVTPNW